MENEVSSISKLGIVLIALAVLIGLGFGIFQISKQTANSGVTDVQEKLDTVSQSAFVTYDQKVITGTMASGAVSDFEGKSVAVLISTQAWIDLIHSEGAVDDAGLVEVSGETGVHKLGSGISSAFNDNDNTIPVILAYDDIGLTKVYTMIPSNGTAKQGAFINYNAVLGSSTEDAAGTTEQVAEFTSYGDGEDAAKVYMAGIYYDANCFRCTSGFATTESGKVIFNNIASNLSKTGRTEYIPSGAKFDSYLVKDSSGTTMGIALIQVGGK